MAGKCVQAACMGKELNWFDWVQIYGVAFGPFLFLIIVGIVAIIWMAKRW